MICVGTRWKILNPFYSLTPALLRQASYGTIKIGLYHFFKRKLAYYMKGEVAILISKINVFI